MPIGLLFSKPQWEVIEACLIQALDEGMSDDQEADAMEILTEIRVYLQKDPEGILDLIGDEVTDAYKPNVRGGGGLPRKPGGVPRPPGADLPDQPEGVVES